MSQQRAYESRHNLGDSSRDLRKSCLSSWIAGCWRVNGIVPSDLSLRGRVKLNDILGAPPSLGTSTPSSVGEAVGDEGRDSHSIICRLILSIHSWFSSVPYLNKTRKSILYKKRVTGRSARSFQYHRSLTQHIPKTRTC